ncbi:MAG: NAD(P)-dependent glycerol-3-phosphate dehydrogenase [Rickettsiales bacterium]|nr:NAD(P)-dependent glycerol-3-phosphate dehydrogenase [Rickettsiales bacterium]
MVDERPHFGVIGAGGWGTALAVVANRSGSDVTMWTRNENVANVIANKRVNEFHLPDVFIDPDINVTEDLAHVCQTSNYLILSVPAQNIRTICISLSDQLSSQIPVIIASKGIERGSLSLMSEVVRSILPENPVLILSGPNFAREVAMGMPSATTIAGYNRTIAEKIIYAIGGKFFRPYFSEDVVGVQVGGAIKNVIAIACGIATGRNLGENARAALITRGLAEMSRLARVKGGNPETLSGLSGIGDLMLTCSSATSRNMALGFAIGEGKPIGEVLPGNTLGLAEGVTTAESVYQLSKKLGISMPICTMVHEVLEGLVDIDSAVDNLLSRPISSE